MVFEEEPYSRILATVGSELVETGGILLGSRDDYVVKKFVYDPHGSRFSAGYDPDITFLNKVIKEEWEKNHLALIGFVHSHPRGIRRLSGDWGNGYGDIGYLRKIFAAIPPLEKFLVPIIYSTHDGDPFEIFPYIAFRDQAENYEEANLVIRKSGADLPTISQDTHMPRLESGPPIKSDDGPPRRADGKVETYRTKDGEAEFTFRFVKVDDQYEVDILETPSYGNLDTSLHITHRVNSPRGGYQADMGLIDKRNLDEVQQMASQWAEFTWTYIKSNKPSR
ncbi:MAG TPA: hypothetical protein VKA60_09785 [Blastocatellia bacterium]|nr:hypothetical protein [Blastocatellia bacterium]